jgi:hypothetical protein
MLLGVGDQFAERFPLIRLARRFGDFEQAGNLALMLPGVSPQGIFLDFKGEAFPFLLTAADAREGNEPFHDSVPRESTSNKRPTVIMIARASSGVNGAS